MLIRFGSSKIVKVATSLGALTNRWNGGLIKRAAKNMDTLNLDPSNYLYLRNRAVSALELHGPNQNSDAFEYDELGRKYSTFIGKNISVDHIGTEKIGTVLDSEFMHSPEERTHFGLPMMPLGASIESLNGLCSRSKDTFGVVKAYAEKHELVRGSDQKMLVEAVCRRLANCGWVENIWAIERRAANEHTPGMADAMLAGEITDSSMGCAPAGTKILMADFSEKEIQNIVVGDKVITHTGKVESATGLFTKKFDGGMYHINITGLCDELDFTHEHPFYVIRKQDLLCARASEERTKCYPVGMIQSVNSDGKSIYYDHGYEKKVCVKNECVSNRDAYNPSFVAVKDLEVGDYVSYSFSDEVRPTELPKPFFRLLGYYLAEGCAIYGKGLPNRTFFTLHKDEKDFALEIKTLCENLYNATVQMKIHKVSPNALELHVYSAKMTADLVKHGGKLAKTKKVSDEILYAPLDCQLELIGSFINGDGFLDKSKALYLETSSRHLFHNFMWMLSRARILWSSQEQFYPVRPNKCGRSVIGTKALTTWKLRISNPEIGKVGTHCAKYTPENNLGVVKSYNFYYENHLFFPIKSIEFNKDWNGDIYNFEVSGDNSYVANSVSVHNCLVNQAVCSVCGNVATGELPEHEDFCDHIRLHKGRQLPIQGMFVIPFEINRGIEFFEDSLILPFRFGGKAGGEGADREAKLLEVFAGKKRAYTETTRSFSPHVPSNQSQNLYLMVGDMPELVEKNRNEFLGERKEEIQKHIDEQNAPGKHPEGTIVNIKYEGEDTDAVVVDEFEDGTLVVALEDIEEPIEITTDDINEVVEYPEDMNYEDRMAADDKDKTPEMKPEERAATLTR